MHLNDHGPKVMTKTGRVTTGEEAKARRLVANICPWCSSRDMKIRIVKLKIDSVKGTFHSVFICGEAKGDLRKYKKAESNMARWIQKTQASHLTPQTQVMRSQVRQLPDSRNRKGVDSFINSLKSKKGLMGRKHQFEIFNKGGYRFLVVYL
jgi:RecA/RadA recombinase